MKIEFYDFVIDSQKKAIEMKNKKDYSYFIKFAQIIWIINGIINFYFYFKTGDTFKLISAATGLIWFLLFILNFNKSYITEIDFNIIQNVKYKKRLLDNVLIINLTNNKKRLIHVEINNEKMKLVEAVFKENLIEFNN